MRDLRAPGAAVYAAALAYPFALTAAWYDPGASMLAALSLAPLVPLLVLHGRLTAAGVVAGLALALKLSLGLVVVAPALAFVALRVRPASRARQLWFFGLGLLGFAAAVAGLLAIRGELGSYLEILRYNAFYADEGLRSQGGSGDALNHLEIAWNFFYLSGRWQAPAAILAVVGLVAILVVGRARRDRELVNASVVAGSVLLATLVTLAQIAIFNQHLQMLAYPAALIAAVTTWCVVTLAGRSAGAIAAVAVALFAFWASFKNETLDTLTVRPWIDEQVSLTAEALDDARRTALPGTERVTYMVFGRNSEDAHALFSGDGFALTCRWFHQYPFYPERFFTETLDCAQVSRPELVLVTDSFYDPMQDAERWNRFVAGAERLLESDYAVVSQAGQAKVWKRR
jgi:hypothetical protein